MLIKEILLNRYDRKHLREILGERIYQSLCNKNKMTEFSNLCKKLNSHNIDVEELGYSYEKFLIDYSSHKIMKCKEKEIVYKIWKKGFSLHAYSIYVGMSRCALYGIVRNGRETVQEETKYKLIDTFEIKYDLNDLEEFDVEVHDEFCKIIGDKNSLNRLVKKYQIDYPVLFYNDRYSVAFDGWFFRVIKDEYGITGD